LMFQIVEMRGFRGRRLCLDVRRDKPTASMVGLCDKAGRTKC